MAPSEKAAKRSAKAIEDELHLYQAMVESSPTAIVMVDRTGVIQRVNVRAEQLFGHGRDELIGKQVETLIPDQLRSSHEDYRDGFFDDPRSRAMGGGRDLYALTKDGREVPVEIGLSSVETAGGIFALASIIDISERKEAEELLRLQRDEILELSTPVMQVWEDILVLPIIGTLDSARAARLTESLLMRIADDEAAVVIIDISGVPSIDSGVAQHLFKTIQGAHIMGAESIISGVRPETAQAMVNLGIDLGRIKSRSTLRAALQLALRMMAELKRATDVVDEPELIL